jgi:outer membrane protein
MNRSLVSLLVAAALGTAAPVAGAMDLLTAVRLATEIDPALGSSRAQLAATQERVTQARATLGPQASGTAAANLNLIDTNRTRTVDWNQQTLGVLASLPVYRPANRESLRQSELSTQVAEIQLAQARQDLILRVSQAYFDVLVAQDSLAVARAQERAFTEQFEAARRNFEVGTATITDQQEAQSRLDLTRAQEAAISNDLEVKRALLAQLVGRRPEELFTLRRGVDVGEIQAEREGQWAEIARSGNNAVRQAELASEIAQREIERQRYGHQPTLDLVTQANASRNVNAGSTPSNAGLQSYSGLIGLQLGMPLYTGGAIDSRVREAIALQDKAQFDLETARRAAEQGARQTFLGVKSSLEQARALTAAERSSQLALESNQLGFQVGVRINIDVLNAAQQLFSTQRDLARTRYDVLLNSLRLKNTVGDLTEADVARINSLLEPPPPPEPAAGAAPPAATRPGAAPAAPPPPAVSPRSGPSPSSTGGPAPAPPPTRGGRSALPR